MNLTPCYSLKLFSHLQGRTLTYYCCMTNHPRINSLKLFYVLSSLQISDLDWPCLVSCMQLPQSSGSLTGRTHDLAVGVDFGWNLSPCSLTLTRSTWAALYGDSMPSGYKMEAARPLEGEVNMNDINSATFYQSKLSQKASTDSRIGETDSISRWEEQQSDISNGYAYKNGRNYCDDL